MDALVRYIFQCIMGSVFPSISLTAPYIALTGSKLPADEAVQGYCETVYIVSDGTIVVLPNLCWLHHVPWDKMQLQPRVV